MLATAGLLAILCISVLWPTLVIVLVVVILVLVALLASVVVVAVLLILATLLTIIVGSATVLAIDTFKCWLWQTHDSS
jgi:hypothetical protein